jgi:hypothetical protein
VLPHEELADGGSSIGSASFDKCSDLIEDVRTAVAGSAAMKLVGATRATMPSRSSNWTCGSSTSSTAVQRRERANASRQRRCGGRAFDRRVGEGSPRALPESDARAAAVIDDCQPGRPRDRRDGSLSVPDRRRTSETPARPSRREPRHHRVESPRPRVEQLHAGQRRSQPLPRPRHRLDRDDLAAMATSARVSLPVPAAMSTTLRPERRSSRSASHRPASSE